VKSRIVTILLDDIDAVPLGNEPVYAGEGSGRRIVGKTTSAAFGYRVGHPVALAEIDTPISDDTAVEIDIARRMSPGRVTFQPAFDPGGKRMRRSNF
jgi:4-methylaminobutanoate oxidase (formaldehyde-forming)